MSPTQVPVRRKHEPYEAPGTDRIRIPEKLWAKELLLELRLVDPSPVLVYNRDSKCAKCPLSGAAVGPRHAQSDGPPIEVQEKPSSSPLNAPDQIARAFDRADGCLRPTPRHRYLLPLALL